MWFLKSSWHTSRLGGLFWLGSTMLNEVTRNLCRIFKNFIRGKNKQNFLLLSIEFQPCTAGWKELTYFSTELNPISRIGVSKKQQFIFSGLLWRLPGGSLGPRWPRSLSQGPRWSRCSGARSTTSEWTRSGSGWSKSKNFSSSGKKSFSWRSLGSGSSLRSADTSFQLWPPATQPFTKSCFRPKIFRSVSRFSASDFVWKVKWRWAIGYSLLNVLRSKILRREVRLGGLGDILKVDRLIVLYLSSGDQISTSLSGG